METNIQHSHFFLIPYRQNVMTEASIHLITLLKMKLSKIDFFLIPAFWKKNPVTMGHFKSGVGVMLVSVYM